MFLELGKNDKRVEFFKYPGEGHELKNSWQLAAGRALQFFDHYVVEKSQN